MSGICGIVALDGSPVAQRQIEAMTATMARRGPDASAHWLDGDVALGHALLATTAEAAFEKLPLRDDASGCVITADVRLDNREELIAELGLSGETRVIGDGELSLAAYLKWGEECAARLLGDFAFAIWDPRCSSLFAARDQMGMRQLLYHHAPGRLFALATDAEAVLAHGQVPRRINEGRVADFIDNLEGNSLTSTMFEGISRLPPAHSLSLSDGVLAIRRYWELKPKGELKLDSDEAYEAAFVAVFTEAVRCRLRSAGPIGAMLSGGVDSNSVAAIAARLLEQDGRGPLLTFSGVSPDPDTCVETNAIRAATKSPGIAPTLIDHCDLGGMLDELIQMTEGCAEPFDAPMTLLRAVYLAGHRAGCRVMLDGVGGDVVLAGGNRVAELLHEGHLRQAAREVERVHTGWRQARAGAIELVSGTWTAFPSGLRNLRRRLAWWVDDRRTLSGQGLIDAGFARRVDLPIRRDALRRASGSGLPFGRAYRARSITHPHMVVGRERYDRVASVVGIEPRDPFLDLRVIEFCLSLPPSQIQRQGHRKSILRRAMAPFVPPEVVSRRGKEHVGWHFTQALFPRLAERMKSHDQGPARKLIAPAALDRLDTAASGTMDRLHWFELCVLTLWLSRRAPQGESGLSEGPS